MGAWLSATNKSYDVAITHDRSGASGRLHHLTYMMDSREDVLRAADILRDADVPIETGPHKHSIGQTFFLYCYEPGGNRFEIGAGGYLILDPDWKPVVWTQAERAKGQAWGLQTVSTFHTHGTPPVPDPRYRALVGSQQPCREAVPTDRTRVTSARRRKRRTRTPPHRIGETPRIPPRLPCFLRRPTRCSRRRRPAPLQS